MKSIIQFLEVEQSFLILGIVWLMIAAISLLTALQAFSLGDYAVKWTAVSIGIAYTFIGNLFIFINNNKPNPNGNKKTTNRRAVV
jgi:hypothetical protein